MGTRAPLHPTIPESLYPDDVRPLLCACRSDDDGSNDAVPLSLSPEAAVRQERRDDRAALQAGREEVGGGLHAMCLACA